MRRLRINQLFWGLLLLFTGLTYSSRLASQPLVITASLSQGCAPLIVQFNSSMPSFPAGAYSWNLGNGNVSTIAQPLATYINPGTYTITLSVNDNGTIYTDNHTITVFSNPTANFSAQGGVTSGCAPLQIGFNNTSSAGSAAINSWLWNYGDGVSETFASATNPSHLYANPGNFTVTLQVTDGNGCQNSKSVPNYIQASGGPAPVWYANPNVFCITPATTNIVNNMGSGNTYVWSTSDGQSSTLISPSFTFSVPNQPVTISLVATDQQGCSNSSSATVQIGNVVSNFLLPEVICKGNSFVPVNQTQIGNTYQWSFGGSSSNLPAPNINLTTPGWNTISLTSSLNGTCLHTFTDSVFVEYANANYQLSMPYVCELPQNEAYINTSFTNSLNGGLTYNWNIEFFGPSSTQSPVILYTHNPNLFADYFEIFHDTLIVTSPNGCKDTATSQLDIYLPVVEFVANPYGGCVPLIVYPSNYSFFTVCPYDSFTDFSWNWGDGTFPASGFTPPSHIYLDTGSFNLVLTATTAMGCVIDAAQEIQVGDTINIPDFIMLTPDTLCGSETILFQNTSTILTNEISYSWSVNGNLVGLAADLNYDPIDVGWQDVMLTVNNNMCVESKVVNHQVYVNGPITQIGAMPNCDSTYFYQYYMMIGQAYDDFVWDFGDNSFDSVNAPISSHYYTQSGDMAVNIYSINHSTGCEYWDTITTSVRKPVAVITADTSDVCVGDTVNFNSFLCQDTSLFNFMFSEAYYLWNFGDSIWYFYTFAGTLDSSLYYQTNDSMISHHWTEPGVYEVQLVIADRNYCYDTAYHYIQVHGPIPQFDMLYSDNCAPVPVSFVNQTVHDTVITDWFWDFSTGVTSTDFDPPAQVFTSLGIYPISLTAIDTIGCVGTTTQYLAVSAPLPAFTMNDDEFCLGDTLWVDNQSAWITPHPIFTWNYGAGNLQTGLEPYFVFNQQGIFNIILSVNDGGCIRSTPLNANQVEVQTAVFDIDTVISGHCFPVFIDFSFQPQVSYYTMLWWDFDNGGISGLPEPQYVYSAPGTYMVSLNVTTSGGCTGQSMVEVEVGGANADFSISDHSICLGDSIFAQLYNMSNVGEIILDLGDGFTSDTSALWHTYTEPGINDTVFIFATYYDKNGMCPITDSAQLLIVDVRPDFLLGLGDIDSTGCVPHVVDLVNQSVNANTYDWDFGNGSTSAISNPDVIYTDPGEYLVSLTVGNALYGCLNVTTKKKVRVFPLPEVNLFDEIDLCAGDSTLILVNPSGPYQYAWSPAYFLNDSTLQNPTIYPDHSITLSLLVTDTNLCSIDTSIYVFVQSLDQISFEDTSIIVGSTVEFDLGGLTQIQIDWNPVSWISNPGSLFPIFQPLEDMLYVAEIVGMAGDKVCFTYLDSMYIDVVYEFTVDLPNLFSPNGDSKNDVLYVRGWGIKELVEFSVYNRWGERIYSGNDLNQGWDGSYQGKPQPIETYFWFVKVKTFADEEITRRGSTTLIR